MVGKAHNSPECHDLLHRILHDTMRGLVEDREDLLDRSSFRKIQTSPGELLSQWIQKGHAPLRVCCDYRISKAVQRDPEPFLTFQYLPGVSLAQIHLTKYVQGQKNHTQSGN